MLRLKNLVQRAAELLFVLLAVSFGTFVLVSFMDGDPAASILGEGRRPEEYAKVREDLGLNDPLLSRFWDWLSGAIQFDFGQQVVPPYSDVTARIAAALPVSIELAALGLFFALATAIPLALWSAARPGGRVDRVISAGAFATLSVPSFLAGLLLILVFVNSLAIFPRAQWARLGDGLWANLHHALLPAIVIGLAEAAMFVRVLRNDLVETLNEDFVLAAKAKGMSTAHVLVRDALRPSSFSLITISGLSLGRLIGSTVIVEYLFALPGMGSLVVGAANQGDYPMILGAVMVISVIYVMTNALIDLSYGYLDPRIRRGNV